jgi:arachidonate 15-lipoxygenase (second type)/8-lipoxygenase (S-type)
MQRLSISPYQIRRLNPASDVPQFTIDDSTANTISGMTLQDLFQQGRLFYADYRDQKDLPSSAGHYAAACDAFFYINAKSGDFLPLAIRTNVGANLIYTPLDSPNDWLLAKMMYNVNDFWFGQWNHLAGTHETVHIIWMAAIRSLSNEHPVFAILNRRKT